MVVAAGLLGRHDGDPQTPTNVRPCVLTAFTSSIRREVQRSLIDDTVHTIPAKKGDGMEELTTGEKYWRDTQPFLVKHGYELRPRFRPGWIPSWMGTDMNPVHCEDSIYNPVRSFY